MGFYILKRLLLMIPTLIGIMLVTFAVIQFAPGGPVERVIAKIQGTDVEATARIGGSGMVVAAPWPDYDPALTQDSVLTLPVQVNGKRRGEILAPAGAEPADVEKLVLDDPEIARRLEGLTIRKVIVVKDRIVNIVAA